MLFSGFAEKKEGNQRGVAIALRGYLRTAWKQEDNYSLITERVMQVRIKVNRSHMNVIAVYAPTEVDDEVESERFYKILQQQIDKANKKDFVIFLGDFNARVGPLNIPARLHGLHNPDVRNRNSTRLVDLCNNNGFIITNTIFPHKNMHQWTWHHPHHKGGHVLDYVLISHEFRAQIYDSKVSRNTTHTSDHNLVISKLILNNNKKYTKRTCKKTINKLHMTITNPAKLNTDIIKKFREKLETNFKNINLHQPIEDTYKCFKESFVNASITTFPKKTMFEKKWVNDEEKKLCEEKSNYHLQIKTLKANGHAIPHDLTHRYKQARSKTKIACRKAIDTWWENKAEEAEKITEKSIKQGSEGSILKMLKLIKTSKIKTSTNLKDEDGITIITSSNNKINRWKEYFAKSAKNDTVVDDKAYNELIPPTISLAPEVVENLSRPISKTELLRALKQTKMETVPGIDEISSNMLKAGAEVTVEWLEVIMEKIWETESIPRDWTNQIIIPIHKHGSRSRCENYRGISLLCVASKIFGKAVLNRMQDVVESQLGDHQAKSKRIQ